VHSASFTREVGELDPHFVVFTGIEDQSAYLKYTLPDFYFALAALQAGTLSVVVVRVTQSLTHRFIQVLRIVFWRTG